MHRWRVIRNPVGCRPVDDLGIRSSALRSNRAEATWTVSPFHNRNRPVRVKLTSTSCHPTLEVVIRSFRHRGLRRLWGGDSSRIGAILRDRVEDVLAVLDAASTAADLDFPGIV